MPRLATLLTLSFALACPAMTRPAQADSQSSNSSSNCSNGICTRSESYVTERQGRRQGWVREDAWRERGRGNGPWLQLGDDDRRHDDNRRRPRRDRDDDDDDD